MSTTFTPWMSLIGGMLIGVAALILMLTLGRIAGISGILGRLLNLQSTGKDNNFWAIAFIAGLVLAPVLLRVLGVEVALPQMTADPATLLLGGLLVGVGSAMGSGCTSGHGVCGISRLSTRSIVATGIFMFTAALTVYIMRHGFAAGA